MYACCNISTVVAQLYWHEKVLLKNKYTIEGLELEDILIKPLRETMQTSFSLGPLGDDGTTTYVNFASMRIVLYIRAADKVIKVEEGKTRDPTQNSWSSILSKMFAYHKLIKQSKKKLIPKNNGTEMSYLKKNNTRRTAEDNSKEICLEPADFLTNFDHGILNSRQDTVRTKIYIIAGEIAKSTTEGSYLKDLVRSIKDYNPSKGQNALEKELVQDRFTVEKLTMSCFLHATVDALPCNHKENLCIEEETVYECQKYKENQKNKSVRWFISLHTS